MIYYVSNSYYPSKEANLVHILNQCYAFKKAGKKIKIFLLSSFSKEDLIKDVKDNFDLKFNENDFEIIKTNFFSYKEPRISIYSFFYSLFNKYDNVISRNIYFSYLYLLKNNNKLITEFHNLETSKVRSFIQKSIIENKKSKSIFISKRLKFYLNKKIKINNNIILHDAARKVNFLTSKLNNSKKTIKSYFDNNNKICSYCGSLYKGRGIDIIIDLSKNFKNINFLIIGNNEKIKLKNSKNLVFIGYQNNIDCLYFLKASDILIMPYQKNVSIGVKNIDTSKIMSPLKLFEYMSLNKPIISSNLPVLREVLINNYNSYLAISNSLNSWINSLKKGVLDKNNIGKNAYHDFINNHQWKNRANKIIEFFEK